MFHVFVGTYAAYLVACYITKVASVASKSEECCADLVRFALRSYKDGLRAADESRALQHIGAADAYLRSARAVCNDQIVSDLCGMEAHELAANMQKALAKRGRQNVPKRPRSGEVCGAT